jgi:thioredoxin reductase
VVAVLGESAVRAVRILDTAGERELPCEGVVVKLGVEPNTEWCRERLAHDDLGYILVDARLATSGRGVWAAGDVIRPLRASVPVAAGHGALAAAAIRAAVRGS